MDGTRREALAWATGGTIALAAAAPARGAVRARPRLGMNLYLFTDAVTPDFYPLLRTLKRLGLDGVEIPITRGHAERFGELRRVLDDEGLACTTLSSLKPEANPVSPDPAVRTAAVDALKWAIDTGHQLGSRTLSGPLYAASDTFTGKGPTSDELARSADVLAQACAYAKPAGQTLCLEFLNRFEAYLVNTVAQTLALIERAGADNLAIAYDTHHAHIEEGSAMGSIRAAGAKLHHTHISESHRGALGTGQVNWPAIFGGLDAIGYDGWLMVEGFSTDVEPLARSAHVWRDVFPSKEEVALDGVAFLRKWTAARYSKLWWSAGGGAGA